jgi:hypothetical protein
MRSELQRFFRTFGYDVRRYRPDSSEASRLSAMLRYHQIDLCLDVGANVGQAGLNFRNNLVINVSSNSVSSSVLPMLDAHGNAAPESRYTRRETVPLQKLDSAAAPYVTPNSKTFLKVDTQGYERQVLEGASNLLLGVTGVSLEVSLIPLYAGQQLMPEIVKYMENRGFSLWGVMPAFVVAQTGRTLQLDAIFFRAD